MRQQSQRERQKTQHMNAVSITMDAQRMLYQLALPVDPKDTIKARRERAIRRAGLSPAKGMRLWYAQACSLLATEYFQIKAAYKAHIENQEARLAKELEHLRELQAREQQHELGLADETTHFDAVAKVQDALVNPHS